MITTLVLLAALGQDVDFRPLHERGECGCKVEQQMDFDYSRGNWELKSEYPLYMEDFEVQLDIIGEKRTFETDLYPEKVTYADTKDAYQDAVQEISENGGTRAVAFCRNGHDYRQVLKFIEQLKDDGYNGEYPIPLVIPTKRDSTKAFRNYWGFNEKTRWPYIALIRRDSRTMRVQGVRSVDLDLPATTTQYAEYLGSYSTFREASSSGSAWGAAQEPFQREPAQKESFQKQQYQRQQYRLQPLLRGRGLFGGRACAT